MMHIPLFGADCGTPKPAGNSRKRRRQASTGSPGFDALECGPTVAFVIPTPTKGGSNAPHRFTARPNLSGMGISRRISFSTPSPTAFPIPPPAEDSARGDERAASPFGTCCKRSASPFSAIKASPASSDTLRNINLMVNRARSPAPSRSRGRSTAASVRPSSSLNTAGRSSATSPASATTQSAHGGASTASCTDKSDAAPSELGFRGPTAGRVHAETISPSPPTLQHVIASTSNGGTMRSFGTLGGTLLSCTSAMSDVAKSSLSHKSASSAKNSKGKRESKSDLPAAPRAKRGSSASGGGVNITVKSSKLKSESERPSPT